MSIGTPHRPVKSGAPLKSLVPQKVVLSTPSGPLVQKYFLLAVSADDGRNWSFIDLGGMTSAPFSLIFPELAEGLDFPNPLSIVSRQVE